MVVTSPSAGSGIDSCGEAHVGSNLRHNRTVAPAGGCPGNFFTTRKWTFEHDKLILRDYKGQALAEFSFAGGRFEGQTTSGGTITLARP